METLYWIAVAFLSSFEVKLKERDNFEYTWNLDTIDISIMHPGELRYNAADLKCRNILTFPSGKFTKSHGVLIILM